MRVANASDAYAAVKLRRESSASRAILPLYHRTMRFLSDPYTRMKKRALLGAVGALVLLYLVMMGFASHDDVVVVHDRPGFKVPTAPTYRPLLPVDGNGGDDADRLYRPGLRRDGEGDDVAMDGNVAAKPLEPIAAVKTPRDEEEGAMDEWDDEDEPEDNEDGPEDDQDGAEDVDAIAGEKKSLPLATPASTLPYFVRMVLPLLAGFCFGFLGSVPVAGPTSAMVLKLGIQGKYQTALTIAFGGAISEATYAGVAFWGFGSFLAGAKFLLPVSKVLGAVMFTIVGIIFLKSEVKSPLDLDASASHKGMRARPPRDEVLRNILMGLTMSGINPSLLATYTGAIASVYGTGLLEFTLFLAFVFAIGVCCGVSTWFFILVSLLQKYKQRLKKQTIGYIMRGMGCFLLTLGALCAKSSVEYFFFASVETTA